ncbi:MAG: type II toxin-antitoxin system VapC family toxin [Deltaproteobacteria bacterium]|nr:type II toxin-antitoxin system VapC family toxin [Deltaproteobacteria bacterium]
MVLVDTSIWVAHLRHGAIGLEALLHEGRVVCHPFIVGELACGNIRNRLEIISLLQKLPEAIRAEHEEVMQFIETYGLMGKGLGYIDVHLLASAMLTGIPLWTLDKRLNETAIKLGLAP